MKPHLPEKAESLLTDASNLTWLIVLASHGLNADCGAAVRTAAVDASAKIRSALEILQGRGGAS